MKELDEIIEAQRREVKTFHPVHERGQDAWFPGNEASGLVIQVQHIWDDLQALNRMYLKEGDEYGKKLLLKYVVIEVRSLIEVFDRLQAIVMRAPTFDPRERQGWREITVEEKEQAKELLRSYTEAKKQTSKMIIEIRNTICAHRGSLDWQQVMTFWDAITPDLVNPILNAVPKVFDYIKELDLFEWNRTPREGVIEIIGTHLRPEYFEDKEQAE
ncbi:hypothetical protein ACW4YW_11620 [Methylobacillus pratensis]